MRGNPLFAKSRIPPHPLRQKLLNMILQSCAGDKLITVSRRLRNHLGVFGKRVQAHWAWGQQCASLPLACD